MARRGKNPEHQDISILQTYDCPGPSNFPTGFSSFPGNTPELLISCSHISHLGHTAPTASYNTSTGFAEGGIVVPQGRTFSYGASSALPR